MRRRVLDLGRAPEPDDRRTLFGVPPATCCARDDLPARGVKIMIYSLAW
jgi:hypothetical protein